MEKENCYEMTIWECITKRLSPNKDFIEEFRFYNFKIIYSSLK